MEFLHIILDVLRNAVMITGMVIVMMLMIECINIRSRGNGFARLKGSPTRQVFVAALLGLLPGCIGGFATVSLYTHRLLGLGALVAMMIATSGDEAFFMLATMPGGFLLLSAVLFVVAVAAGLTVNRFSRGTRALSEEEAHDLELHGDEMAPLPAEGGPRSGAAGPAAPANTAVSAVPADSADSAGSADLADLTGSAYLADSDAAVQIVSVAPDTPDTLSGAGKHGFHNMRRPSPRRIALLVAVALFLSALGAGLLEHDHEGETPAHPESEQCLHEGHTHESHANESHVHGAHSHTATATDCADAHSHTGHAHAASAHSGHAHAAHVHSGHSHAGHTHEIHTHGAHLHADSALDIFDEYWINLLFAAVSFILLYYIMRAPDHVIDEHLWHHVVCRHLLPIFCWTFGALGLITAGLHYLDLEPWLRGNIPLAIVVAALVGLIPESGPHLIFVTLYASGLAPFSVLLASSISQDGHACIPLLADSRRSFFLSKLINAAVALLCGFICWQVGF